MKHTGAGQFYLISIRDADGRPLEGSRHYRLTVPADPPVELYWSATAYDRETHALVREVPYASRASTTPGLRTNDDGSVDLHVGPTPPEGGASNWLPSHPDRRLEILVRFYGPTSALFDKSWTLPDVVALD
ncbi:DUF1214 domain-containing protein [Sediminihabitans luteus]|uniref:DUF1214 domain-containing protein n=1 Tax=Sediminihabitans luteus TaxID=1138585 RepID=UPI001EF31A16|nr:DUF1214 domain-containing protein [Sediminihabitans luteus]